jgi:PPM family protein phosphatase
MSVAAYGATHPGPRSTNEDALLIDVEAGLFVVADGMGGHNAGEVASGLAIETIQQFIRKSADRSGARLEEAVRCANQEILMAAAQRPDYAGMGTTVAAVLVNDHHASLTSIGDSRVYRWHGGKLAQLTRDDSWIAKMLSDGASLSAPEIERHPMRHVLTEVVGVRSDLEPRASECDFESGDALLLCSDGLHGVVSSNQLAAVMRSSGGVKEMAARLVEQAVAHGATDNVTAVVVRRES